MNSAERMNSNVTQSPLAEMLPTGNQSAQRTQRRVIVRIKGGLGNQLFQYAAARRLAIANDAELVIDHQTGFVRDYLYQQKYALHNFGIAGRLANGWERMEPFERYQRALRKLRSRRQAFAQRRYLEQEGVDFDGRLLEVRVGRKLYLEGYWQSERYFKDIESTIRQDLTIMPPQDAENQRVAHLIRHCEQPIALHVRWFDKATASANASVNNVDEQYYAKAIQLIEQKVESPTYFVFSDDVAAAQQRLPEFRHPVTFVSHNQRLEQAYADLWLMSQCQHFVAANSTFSWWGGWLANHPDKIVITPWIERSGTLTAWNIQGLIPDDWIKLRMA
jgi:Glycosyl transferase family 11